MEIPPALRSTFRNLWRQQHDEQGSHWKAHILRTIIVIALYMALDKTLMLLANLPAAGYHRPLLPGLSLANFFNSFYPILLALLVIPFIMRRLLCRWSDFERGKTIRILLCGCAFMLCWKYATADFNYYLNNWYVADRLILVLTFLMLVWRPVFLLPFLLTLLTIIGQYQLLPVYSLAAESLLIRSGILFMSFFLISLVTRYFSYQEFVFLIGCILAAHYFESGFLKLNPEWLLFDNIPYLLPNVYANGWLSHLSPDQISSITDYLGTVNIPMKAYTIIIECGMLMVFANLRFTRIILFAAILFHLGIFLITGIFFWMWILYIVLLIIYVFNTRDERIRHLFSRRFLLLSLPIIVLGEFWCDPVALAWHDSSINYTFKFQAEMDNSTTHHLPPDFFSPYYYQFTLGNFKFLSPAKLLPVVWGATNSNTSRRLRNSPSVPEILEFEQKAGRHYDEPEKKNFLINFVQQFAYNWNSKKNKRHFVNYLQPPRLLMNFPAKFDIPAGNRITEITILEVTSHYSYTHGYQVIRTRKICEIAVSPASAGPE